MADRVVDAESVRVISETSPSTKGFFGRLFGKRNVPPVPQGSTNPNIRKAAEGGLNAVGQLNEFQRAGQRLASQTEAIAAKNVKGPTYSELLRIDQERSNRQREQVEKDLAPLKAKRNKT